ncbi:MAG: Lar family restriction alleviation protein [Synergistaceae bacterium]|nr:Lar family restriction alleviation protein [Synergistaceae bacterium]
MFTRGAGSDTSGARGREISSRVLPDAKEEVMTKKLKPCPFCGSEVDLQIGEAMLEQVTCPGCGA